MHIDAFILGYRFTREMVERPSSDALFENSDCVADRVYADVASFAPAELPFERLDIIDPDLRGLDKSYYAGSMAYFVLNRPVVFAKGLFR
jgi:hypothetical protein